MLTANTRTLSTIAREIAKDWKSPGIHARPYLQAMMELHSIEDKYGADDAKSVVLYFLSNAKGWQGPVAQRIKAELRELAGKRPYGD